MKRYLYFMLLLFLPITSGCWDRVEVNDLAFVMATSLDLTEDGKLVETIQTANLTSEGQNGQGGAGGGQKIITMTVTGKNNIDLDQKEQEKMSRKMYIAHRSVLIIGERLAKHGIRDILDWYGRNPESRLRTYILIARGTDGRDVLKVAYPLERNPAVAMKEMEKLGSKTSVTLREFMMVSANEGINPVAGYIEPVTESSMGLKQQEEEQKEPDNLMLKGTAVFKNFKLVGYLDSEETGGLIALTGKFKRGSITAENIPGVPGNVGLNITKEKLHIHPYLRENKIKFNIALKAEGDIFENNTNLDLSQPQNMKIVQDALCKSLEQRMRRTLSAAQNKFHVDIFGFGQAINRSNPKLWKSLKEQWDEKFSEAEFSIAIDLTVRRSGMSGAPLQIKEDEVKKE
ncbi:Ger(x)C family spore germination protein [Paenibacillus rhizophilus]|nr:Ger(x)C family spore germination protein [Paenibacillus rhizophilus]